MQKNMFKKVIARITLVTLLFGSTVYASTSELNNNVNGKWTYTMAANDKITGWNNGIKTWYYTQLDGSLFKGWKLYNGKWYYMDNSGVMVTDWQEIDNKWYYFNVYGDMVTGWKHIEGYDYYFYQSGSLATNTTIGVYRVNKHGVYTYDRTDRPESPGWHSIGGTTWYYIGVDGNKFTDLQKIDGKWYCFDWYGNMVTGWYFIGNRAYYMNSNGECTSNITTEDIGLQPTGPLFANNPNKYSAKTWYSSSGYIATAGGLSADMTKAQLDAIAIEGNTDLLIGNELHTEKIPRDGKLYHYIVPYGSDPFYSSIYDHHYYKYLGTNNNINGTPEDLFLEIIVPGRGGSTEIIGFRINDFIHR